jgi:adenylate kinase
MTRLTGRRMCKKCGANFNVNTLPPAKPGICDKCGAELYQRDDDKEAVIANRLKVYGHQTAPLIDYYKKKNMIKDINASEGSIDDIVANISKALSGK